MMFAPKKKVYDMPPRAPEMVWVMEKKGDLSFNCAESVVLKVNKNRNLPGFDTPVLRIASMFGGGVGGSGAICGAVSGAAMSLGLAMGTNGTESKDHFETQRKSSNELIKRFVQDFTDAWGTVQCEYLKAMDEGKEPSSGSQRAGPHEKDCDKYVEWAAKRVVEILESVMN
jgi:C_GCAxxG_C_C family probable redox protein